MKSPESVSAETDAVNKEQEVTGLKRLREGRGLTLKGIFSVTRITVTNLEAIETGNYHLLPEPVYARTFIKTYAGILETDSKPILQQYENYLRSLDKIHDAPEEDQKKLPVKEKKIRNIRFPLWVVAASVLFGLIVLIVFVDVNDIVELFSVRRTSSHKMASLPIPATAPAPNIPVTAPTGSPTSTVTRPGQTPASQGGGQKQEQALNLKIEAVERTWIRISADQKQAEQMILSKGDRIERTARESFIIDVGNAGGVLMSFQDKPLHSLGKRGEVAHLKLP